MKQEQLPLFTYMADSDGPTEADELLMRHHHKWNSIS